MSEKLEWDWPPTIRHRRRPRVEVLPPEEPPARRYHVDVTIRHHRRSTPWLVPAVIIVAVLVLWRLKFGLLLLGALVGWETIGAALFVGVIIVALAAWRERRAGRVF
jgi:hypothetical protein